MPISSPDGGGPFDQIESVAICLSRDDPGETYILVEPIAGNRAPAFVTNDTRLAHDASGEWCMSYYLGGRHMQEGADMIAGLL